MSESQTFHDPNWKPLEAFVSDDALLADWMWMNSDIYEGERVEFYKHKDTRQYLILSQAGEPVAAGAWDAIGLV